MLCTDVACSSWHGCAVWVILGSCVHSLAGYISCLLRLRGHSNLPTFQQTHLLNIHSNPIFSNPNSGIQCSPARPSVLYFLFVIFSPNKLNNQQLCAEFSFGPGSPIWSSCAPHCAVPQLVVLPNPSSDLPFPPASSPRLNPRANPTTD